MMEFDRKQLSAWLQLALETNTQFHLNRKNLLDRLLKCKGRGVTVSSREFFILKQYLSMRSEKLQKAEDAELAYQELIGHLIESLEGDASVEAAGDEEQKADNAPSGAKGKPEEH